MDLSQLLHTFRSEIQRQLKPEEYEGWLEYIRFTDIEPSGITVSGIPHPIFRDDIKRNYDLLFRKTLSAICPELNGASRIKLNYCVGKVGRVAEVPQQTTFAFAQEGNTKQVSREKNAVSAPASFSLKQSAARSNIVSFPSQFNPKMGLDSFISGRSNQLAYEASLRVTRSLGELYNPLYIYGGIGSGKTHLLEGIGVAVNRLYPSLKLVYVKAEEFLNEFVTHLQQKKMRQFRERYRLADILLIDDIDHISGAMSSQDELLNTFVALSQQQKQIIVTGNTVPGRFQKFQKGLCSFLESGLTAELQKPSLELRIAILQSKAKRDSIHLPPDVAFFMAESIHSSIRKLEGALIRLGAYASLLNEKISLGFAKNALADMLEAKEASEARSIEGTIGDADHTNIEEILLQVCEVFDVSLEDLQSARRDAKTTKARQICVYFLKEFSNLSLAEIGSYFGNRSHSSIHYAFQQISSKLKSDEALLEQVQTLKKYFLPEFSESLKRQKNG